MNAGLVCTSAPAPLAVIHVCALGVRMLEARKKRLGWGLERERRRCAPCVLEDVRLTWCVTAPEPRPAGVGTVTPAWAGDQCGGTPIGGSSARLQDSSPTAAISLPR